MAAVMCGYTLILDVCLVLDLDSNSSEVRGEIEVRVRHAVKERGFLDESKGVLQRCKNKGKTCLRFFRVP